MGIGSLLSYGEHEVAPKVEATAWQNHVVKYLVSHFRSEDRVGSGTTHILHIQAYPSVSLLHNDFSLSYICTLL